MDFALLPKITEKTMSKVEDNNVYTFVLYGNKKPVSKKMVEAYVSQNFKVTVEKVHSQIRTGKPKRAGTKRNPYRTKTQKMFMVKVKKGDEIPGFNLSDDSSSK